jgi:hypothetical protein
VVLRLAVTILFDSYLWLCEYQLPRPLLLYITFRALEFSHSDYFSCFLFSYFLGSCLHIILYVSLVIDGKERGNHALCGGCGWGA